MYDDIPSSTRGFQNGGKITASVCQSRLRHLELDFNYGCEMSKFDSAVNGFL